MSEINTLMNIQSKLAELDEKIDTLNKMVNRLKIDSTLMIERKEKIQPGIGTKIVYDYNGLVTGSDKLNQKDIPELSISKIDGLEDILDSKASVGDINRLNVLIRDNAKQSTPYMSGCKVNVDKNGHVINTTSLLVDDIPQLPIEKINGLVERLNQVLIDTADSYHIRAGVGSKIEYDSAGRVVRSYQLSMDDLPSEVNNRLNKLEASLNRISNIDNIQSINKSLSKKIDMGEPVTPGTYTKVRVDYNGLVTSGGQLSKSDLPSIGMNDIDGLTKVLMEKANVSDVDRLNETVSSLVGITSKIGQVSNIKNELSNKASKDDIDVMKRDIKELKSAVDRLMKSVPSTKLADKVSNIEKNLNEYITHSKSDIDMNLNRYK